ncbi:UDP-N-acetylglucosamine transferase subunit ALG14 like [Schistosoma japonicum]|nr:UDP-N-acetylglucosamine transferase subunit ALG14 like [Schistosoma japonicum]
MLSYVSVLTPKYQPRTYVIAATDSISEQKVFNLEDKSDIKFSVKRIRRAREVKQSYVSSIFYYTYVFPVCISYFRLVGSYMDFIVLTNTINNMLRLHSTLIIFVESICRTKTLSLSGKILYHTHLVDVIVQWPELKTKYPKSIYLGLLS